MTLILGTPSFRASLTYSVLWLVVYKRVPVVSHHRAALQRSVEHHPHEGLPARIAFVEHHPRATRVEKDIVVIGITETSEMRTNGFVRFRE